MEPNPITVIEELATILSKGPFYVYDIQYHAALPANGMRDEYSVRIRHQGTNFGVYYAVRIENRDKKPILEIADTIETELLLEIQRARQVIRYLELPDPE
jgi:hypothetical protein